MCDLDDESEFETSDSEYDNTASATASEASAEGVISNGVSKGENGDVDTIESGESKIVFNFFFSPYCFTLFQIVSMW